MAVAGQAADGRGLGGGDEGGIANPGLELLLSGCGWLKLMLDGELAPYAVSVWLGLPLCLAGCERGMGEREGGGGRGDEGHLGTTVTGTALCRRTAVPLRCSTSRSCSSCCAFSCCACVVYKNGIVVVILGAKEACAELQQECMELRTAHQHDY